MRALAAAASPGDLSDDVLQVLAIDDNQLDAELCGHELRRAGIACRIAVAADLRQLRTLLKSVVPDVVLCDFSFPGFDGFAAQRLVQEVFADVPLIFVTGTISEERAVAALKSGAVDFVLKSNLIRLPSVVERAVRDAREKKRLERSVEGSERRALEQAERLESLWRIVNDPRLQGPNLISSLLQEAGRSLRAGGVYRGYLARVESECVVIVALGAEAAGSGHRISMPALHSAIPSHETLVSRVGRTQAWDDLGILESVPVCPEKHGWRSVISTRFDAAGAGYFMLLASPVVSARAFGAEDVAYVEVLGSSIARLLEVNELTDTLRDAEERSRLHADRLEALWRLVNDSTFGDNDLFPMVLAQAAVAMHPGVVFRATLWRVRGEELMAEAVFAEDDPALPDLRDAGFAQPIKSRGRLADLLEKGGGTILWDASEHSKDGPAAAAGGAPLLVASTFNAAGATWILSFASRKPAKGRLHSEDRAYVEILASIFANRVQQRWQFERIQYQQSHDTLTGLLSRSQFRSQARSDFRTSTRCAAAIVDINAFREINDSFGHMVGDAVLVEVGNALLKRSLPGELVGRIGGDVFGIYIANPPSRDFVLSRAADFAAAFRDGFSTGDREGKEFIARTASIGIAIAPEDGLDLETILSHADAAVLRAKQRGRGQTVFYEPGMEGDAQRRLGMRNELAVALAEDQFTLYFQPHIEIKTGAVTGCEALIRWNHPERGLVMPGTFIPFAEQTGIISGIDDWVLRHACIASGELGAMRPGFRLYFNLSGRQAGDPKLIRTLTGAARSGTNLGNLGVEITESDAMRDVESTRRVCRALRKLNVRVAIDDFGTGYSSLSVLKRLSVDIVKIDRSFISGLLTDPHDEAIAETIIAISERFGFESLAEGAEQPEEIEWLRRRSCHYVQGYAVCHPLPLAEFKSWLSARPN